MQILASSTSDDSLFRQDSRHQNDYKILQRYCRFDRSTLICSMSDSRKRHTAKFSAPKASAMGRISDHLSLFALADARLSLHQISRLLSTWIKDLLTVHIRHSVSPKLLLSVLGFETAHA